MDFTFFSFLVVQRSFMKKNITQKLFELVGENQDSLTYLNSFKAIPKQSFALIYIDPLAFSEYGESFLFDLKLLQGLELYPIVFLETSVFEYAKHFHKGSLCFGVCHTIELERNLKNYDMFHAERVCVEELKLNFDSISKIQSTIQKQKIPFLIYEDKFSFSQLKPILNELKLSKIIYLLSERVFLEKESQIPISIINLQNEYDFYMSSDFFSNYEKDLLNNFYDLLKSCSNLKSISITLPTVLLKELFTVKGSGTYFKLGSKILVYKSIQNLDVVRLKELIEDAFQKKLYESFFENEFDSIFLESNYKGAAIVKKTPYGNFLSKFAVNALARGEGIGREIWDTMISQYPKIFWRAKIKNPINKWYMKICDGVCKFPNWNVYWIGYEPKDIPEITNYLLNLKEDFYY